MEIITILVRYQQGSYAVIRLNMKDEVIFEEILLWTM
jgi:hypothetical protein